MTAVVGVDIDTTMRALNAGLSIEGITLYLFWVGTVAMGAGAAFFFMQRNAVPLRYQKVMTVAAVICGVACYHYLRMSNIYIEGVAGLFDADGNRIPGAEIGAFPTAYRYIDWLITVPLLVLEFPLLLNLGKKAASLFYSLVFASLIMLVTAWIAEESPAGGGAWWAFYLISCAAWVYIVFVLFTKVTSAMQDSPPSIQSALKTMRMFILVGWAIYPIGFLMALAGDAGESYREIFYNIADVINKVGFGLVCYHGVQVLAERDSGSGEPRLANAA
ncbi:MAG: bacteriorhodopsin [Planctomycetota bacterium]